MNWYNPKRGIPAALECVCCFEQCCFGCAVIYKERDTGNQEPYVDPADCDMYAETENTQEAPDRFQGKDL